MQTTKWTQRTAESDSQSCEGNAFQIDAGLHEHQRPMSRVAPARGALRAAALWSGAQLEDRKRLTTKTDSIDLQPFSFVWRP